METARIISFTETGIEVERLTTGERKVLDCDIVVTATGLVVKTAGGIEIVVDGEAVERMDTRFMYKGCMVSGIPNFILSVGYTNMTFTLKVDLIGTYVCRLLKHMDKKGAKKCVPIYGTRKDENPEDPGEALIDLSSGEKTVVVYVALILYLNLLLYISYNDRVFAFLLLVFCLSFPQDTSSGRWDSSLDKASGRPGDTTRATSMTCGSSTLAAWMTV